MTLYLPNVIDDQSSTFRSIAINTVSLGSLFSSNQTEDFLPVSDQYISYDFYDGEIDISLPLEQLSSFGGKHTM